MNDNIRTQDKFLGQTVAPARRQTAAWQEGSTGKRIINNALILLFGVYLSFLVGLLIGKMLSGGARIGISALCLFILFLSCWFIVVRRYHRIRRLDRLSILQKAMVVLLFLVIFVAVRTFLFHPFNIPSGGSKPTLLVGDYTLASKYSYGYSHYSLPFSPRLFSGRIFASEPSRGDMVVFRHPQHTDKDRIGRLVGLPGERIQITHGTLYIDGKSVVLERLSDFIEIVDGRTLRVKRWRETLPNGKSYETIDLVDNGFYDNTPVYSVPLGHYFILGDNRDNSTDSRILSDIGYVPFENLIGRVVVILWPNVNDSSNKRSPFL